MYYVVVDSTGSKIMEKHFVSVDIELRDKQKEITEELFNTITRLPATFTCDATGNIISVVPAPEPEPTPQLPTQEERIEALESAMLELVLGGGA